MKKERGNFLKILVISNTLVAFFFIIYVFSTKLPLQGAGLVFLILEILIMLSGFAFVTFGRSLQRILTEIVFVIQILLITLLFIPSTQNQIFYVSYNGSFGNTVSNTYIKWASKTPLGIFKADYKAPTIHMISPISYYCITELGDRCKIVTGSIPISVNVTDNTGVKIVKIYVDKDLIKEFSNPPYKTTWDSEKASKSLHAIKAFAEDYAGNYTQLSTQVQVGTIAPPM